MRACLVLCQKTCTHLFSNPRMVLRYLFRLSSTDQISTAITYIRNIGNLATQDGRHASRTHTTAQHVFCRTLINQCIGTLDRSQQCNRHILTIILIVDITDRIYSYFTRYLPCCMPSHTISHNEECPFLCHHLRVLGDDISHIIFIMGTFATNICQLCWIEPKLFGQRTSLPYFCSS